MSSLQEVRQEVARQLAAIDALGGSEWSKADQIRYVRTSLEQGIDALARAEDAQFDFLADCAMLASHNMQDARLHITDERLSKLEKPPSDATLGRFFVELGIILALELAVVATASYAVPALIALAAAGARARALRRVTAPLSHSLEGAVTQRQAASESLKRLASVVADKQATLLRSADIPWMEHRIRARVAALRKAEYEYGLALAAHEGSEELVKKVAAALEAAPGAVPPSLTSPELKAMLDGTLQHAALGRVAEQVATDELVRGLVATPEVSVGASAMFQTSTLVGKFLESNELTRAEAAREWDWLRRHMRVLPDTALVKSEIAHKLLWEMHADPPPPTGPGPGLGSRDQEVIVRGMEVVLWLAWMKQIKALGMRFVNDVPVPGLGAPREGSVWRDMFVTSVRGVGVRDVAVIFADGLQYPGLLALADGHGQYLYSQFAREFFVRTPEACPAPLKFDAARYEFGDELPDGQDRADRLAEMKLLTIVFFQTLEADPTSIGSSDDTQMQAARKLLPTLLDLPPAHDIVAEFLASQPPTSPPDGALPQESAPADPVQEALAESAAERVAHYDAAKLATMVTDLDLRISEVSAVTLVESPDATASGQVWGVETEELLWAIGEQQTAVLKQYQTFQKHAAGQTALLDEVKAEYEARIKLLVDWPPPEFQIYPSTPTSGP